MGALKSNNKDTYKATAITLMLMGVLYLVDKFVSFSSLGLPWVMNKDNMTLYAAVVFLIFKRDKSVGLVLLGIWLVLNIGLIVSFMGQLSGYLLPLVLLVIGGILYLISRK